MKKIYLFALCSILAFAFSVSAQDADRYGSSRLDNLLNRLKGTTVDLVDRSTEDLRRNNSARADVEAAFLAAQFDASVGLFQNIARDNRRASDLRDAASIVSELARRGSTNGANTTLWRDAQNTIADINRELGGRGNGGGYDNGGNNNGGGRSGKAFWRGRVDNEVHLLIRDRGIEMQTVQGTQYDNPTFSFTSALPTRNVTVDVLKKSGRGTVRVLEQPSRNNDYTAVIEILDDKGGADDYQLEISWR